MDGEFESCTGAGGVDVAELHRDGDGPKSQVSEPLAWRCLSYTVRRLSLAYGR